MNAEMLKNSCGAPESPWEWLREPWDLKPGWLGATDGLGAVFVTGAAIGKPHGSALLDGYPTTGNLIGRTTVEALREWVRDELNGPHLDGRKTCEACKGVCTTGRCDACGGRGAHFCDTCGTDHGCGRCDGWGGPICASCNGLGRNILPTPATTAIGKAVVSDRLLARHLRSVQGSTGEVLVFGGAGERDPLRLTHEQWTMVLMPYIAKADRALEIRGPR